MKKVIYTALSVLMITSILLMAGCGNDTKEKTEITILAAASLTDALNEVITEYEKDSSCTVTASYAGSGDLMQQIKGGAPCDIFISASTSHMDMLERDGYIDDASRIDLLTNTLTLISTVEKKDTVTMDSLASDDVKIIAIGEPGTVPAGKYAVQSLIALNMHDDLKDKIVQAKDVRAVLDYIETGNADCGFVYRTDAMMMDDKKGAIICDVDSSLHDPIVYPMTVLKSPSCIDADEDAIKYLEDFYSFLQGETAKNIFEKYGFSVEQ
ncbi:MAG: molybdate ABC transporter substrate-binding protein [Bacillota bacterium]|nr:molybdate ABC transporter substrate-binding protein [Bacillota bacterium]